MQPSELTAFENPWKSTLMTWLIFSRGSSPRIVRTVRRAPPIEYAALSLSVPWPGISTFRSRGIDNSAVARFDGSSRMSIIVSDSGLPIAPRRTSIAFFERLSEPMSRIVWGLPADASVITSSMPAMCFVCWNAFTTLSTSCQPATAVAEADAHTMINAPSRKRLNTPGPAYDSGNAELRRVLGTPFAHDPHEVHECLAVALERRHRHPFLRSVMARALGAELDTRHAGLEPGGDVGSAVAADRDALGVAAGGGGLGQHHHERIGAGHNDRIAQEDDVNACVPDRGALAEDQTAPLPRKKANTHVNHAVVGLFFRHAPAVDAAEVDRWPIEH